MYWTLELASKLEDAPWPATKEELLDYASRSGVLKTFGLTILLKKTSYSTRTNIKFQTYSKTDDPLFVGD